MKLDREWSKIAVVIVGFLWFMFFMLTLGVKFCDGSETFGQMGDAFNMLNTLFAGLAFTAICFQLWMQQTQIEAEQRARFRAERISALTTRIDVTFQKILYERDLLLQVAPGFKNVSFLHDDDGSNTEGAIMAREGLIQSLCEIIFTMEKIQDEGGAPMQADDLMKQLLDNQAALPMMKQIKKWVDQLDSYEKEMDALLDASPASNES